MAGNRKHKSNSNRGAHLILLLLQYIVKIKGWAAEVPSSFVLFCWLYIVYKELNSKAAATRNNIYGDATHGQEQPGAARSRAFIDFDYSYLL
jgi:hypothetical protein